jgi:hypothetical protein
MEPKLDLRCFDKLDKRVCVSLGCFSKILSQAGGPN